MTTRGKVVLTILLLGIVGFGVLDGGTRSPRRSGRRAYPINVDAGQRGHRQASGGPASIPLLAGPTRLRWSNGQAFPPSPA